MPNCMEHVYAEEYYDFLIPYGVESEVPSTPGCVQRIAEDYDIFFYPREGLPPLSIGNYTYTAIPKCYALLDTTALDASGITRLQNQPVLALKGEGVLVGVIDTGVDYTNPLFRYSDGSSRILRIWDQTIQDGTPPEGILYGAEYRKEEIDEALQKKQPYDVVPSRDENGHGTFVTGVVCGGEDIPNGFIGAVPNAGIAVVKLKEVLVAFDESTPFLQDSYAKEPEMFVALYADETVPYKEIVKILNIANENKFKMVLATRPQK